MLKYFNLQVNKIYFTKKSGSGGTYTSLIAVPANSINSGVLVVLIWLNDETAIKTITIIKDNFFMIGKILGL